MIAAHVNAVLAFSEFLREYRPTDAVEIEQQHSRYVERTGIFERASLWEFAQTMHPYAWWKNYVELGSCDKLRTLILQLMTIPCSTASVER